MKFSYYPTSELVVTTLTMLVGGGMRLLAVSHGYIVGDRGPAPAHNVPPTYIRCSAVRYRGNFDDGEGVRLGELSYRDIWLLLKLFIIYIFLFLF